jgi:hypothetical protein
VAEEVARARGEAVDSFAAALRDLRDSIGTPSFRELAGRSRAISHTTLHEAAQGHRLPSWATTVEFVKACGADPADYRERWEQANEAVKAAGSAQNVSAETEAAADPAPTVERVAAPDDRAVTPPTRRRPRYLLPGLVAAAVVAIVVITIALIARSGSKHGGSPDGTTAGARLSPSDCPIHQSNPPPAPPAHRGDASTFVADVTLHDCTHVRRGTTVTKIWRLKNVGTVAWKGYSLHRLDLPQQRDQCQTIDDVPIPDTAAGHPVDITTQVTTPPTPGFCFVRFKMLDASGHVVFPGSRPVNFQLIVD